MDRMLTLPEAMEIAGYKCRKAMLRLIMNGDVSAVRLPSPTGRGHWRISERSLRDLLTDNAQAMALDLIRRHRV
jgi:hypothetical protein